MLTILSIVVGTYMLEMVSGSDIRAQEVTLQRMEAIEQALQSRWLAEGRVPCPAAGDAALDSQWYGTEQGDPDDCTANGGEYIGPIAATCNNWDTLCATTCTSDCGAVYGVVPVRNLNLPDEYALDGWNRRISYVVDQRYTIAQSSTIDPALIVTDDHEIPASATELGRYPVIMISHGRSGNKAFPANGSTVADRPQTRAPNDAEDHNYNSANFNNRFVLQPFRPDLDVADGRFDLIVRPITMK